MTAVHSRCCAQAAPICRGPVHNSRHPLDIPLFPAPGALFAICLFLTFEGHSDGRWHPQATDIAGAYDVHGCSRPVHFLFRAPRAYVRRSHLFTFRSRTRCPAGCPFVPVLRSSHIRWWAVEHVAPWTQEAVARLPHPGLLARGATGRRVPANTGCDLRNTWEVPGGGTPNTPSPVARPRWGEGPGRRGPGSRGPVQGSNVIRHATPVPLTHPLHHAILVSRLDSVKSVSSGTAPEFQVLWGRHCVAVDFKA